jgi:predicted dienelactone hydrolase
LHARAHAACRRGDRGLACLRGRAAGVPLGSPQADGPLSTRTLEFHDLVDAARGGRRVPVKVHLPSWIGPFPVVVLSHGAGGNRSARCRRWRAAP